MSARGLTLYPQPEQQVVAAQPVDVTNARDQVLAKLAELPFPELQAALATLATATADTIEAARADLRQALAGIPQVDLQPVLDAVAGAVKDARDAINAHTTAAVASVQLFYPGQEVRFLADKVPPNFTKLPETSYVASGGFAVVSAATSSGSGRGGAVLMPQGPGRGLWRLRINVLQCFDLEQNVAVGPAYVVPFVSTLSTGHGVGMAVVGTKIYFACVQAATTGSTRHVVFDTATKTFSEAAQFPAALGNDARSLVLNDGRILTIPSYVANVQQQATAATWFLYDPATDAPPVAVPLVLPTTKFYSLMLVAKLPSGKLLCIDSGSNGGNALSCLVEIAGATAAVTAGEDTGIPSTAAAVLLPTATGAMAANNRVYAEGVGWSAGSNPVAYGSVPAVAGTWGQFTPGLGYVFTQYPVVGGSGLAINLWFIAAPLPAAATVAATYNG